MSTPRVAVIGAGVAGLAAAVDLSSHGCEVVLVERASAPGGKLRELEVGGRQMDAGPSVFTMREVFDRLFADAGDDLDRRLTLVPAALLARHAWTAAPGTGAATLDLFADAGRSTAAIAKFAGPREADGFVRFAAHAQQVYRTLQDSFMRAPRPSPVELVRRVGLAGLPGLWNIKPFDTLWQTAGNYFHDPRLQQLFGRYATYCGSSPFQSPATLMLIAHVEQAGVWYVEGGMARLADALAALAVRKGAQLRTATEVREIHVRRGRVECLELADGERLTCDAVICNADNGALAEGMFGGGVTRSVRATQPAARSLSAFTWNLVARTAGFELAHHSVFFGDDYRREFDQIFKQRRLPTTPTLYLCAPDRRDDTLQHPGQAERLFCLMNAPPIGDTHEFSNAEIESCEDLVFRRLARFGLQVERRAAATVVTTPSDFHRLFPATGGALYGPASHGWRASFTRPGSRSTLPGLYLAGGSTHPGPGVPMAATSGRLAAASVMQDFASTARSRRAATTGGT